MLLAVRRPNEPAWASLKMAQGDMNAFSDTVQRLAMPGPIGVESGVDTAARPHARRVSASHSIDRAGLQIGVVTETAALASLAPEWNSLFERAGRPSQVFQTHAFASLYASTYDLGTPGASSRHACNCRLAILTARREGRLVMVWPLVETRRFGVRCLSWLGEPVTQYGDVVLDPAEQALETLQTAFDFIRAEIRPDMFRLRKVRSDAVIAPFLSSLDITPAEPVEAPCVTLAAGGSPFEDRQNGKARKNRRRLMRRLEECGTVVFRELPPGDAASAALAAGLTDKRDWLKRRGLVSPSLGAPLVDRLLDHAATDPHRTTGCAAFELAVDGRPVAFALGFRCKGRLLLHMITYAHDMEKHGVGVLNLEAILRLAEAEGLEAVDLLPPKAEYKLDWADVAVPAGDYRMGLTARGRLVSQIVDGRVIPAIKDTIYRLPMALRRKLAAHTLAHTEKAGA